MSFGLTVVRVATLDTPFYMLIALSLLPLDITEAMFLLLDFSSILTTDELIALRAYQPSLSLPNTMTTLHTLFIHEGL